MAKEEWPPMRSRDGAEIKVNMLLYEPDVSFSEYDRKGRRVNVKVYRVIQTNVSRRMFRLRCHQGCEKVIDVDKSCSAQLYASKPQAKCQALLEKNRVIEGFNKEIEKYAKAKAAVAATKLTIDPTPVEA